MRIDVDEDYTVVLKEVYNSLGLETREGNRVYICMRDDSFEIKVCPKGSEKGQWHTVNMQKGTIELL